LFILNPKQRAIFIYGPRQYLSSDFMKRKGISLPVEMIVIIAVAVLVLVVIAAFFAGGFGPQVNTIGAQAALTKGCNTWKVRSASCDTSILDSIRVSGYDPTGKESASGGAKLLYACNVLGYSTSADCATACGCPSSGQSTGP